MLAHRLPQDLSAPSAVPAPFIVGAARSGTTMLRLMLDAHPQLAIPRETHFIPRLARCAVAEDPAAVALDAIVNDDRWPAFQLDAETLRRNVAAAECRSLSDVLRVFYGSYAAAREKPRWGDKTPWYVLHMPLIAAHLEEAHFIHIIRDGRDVALSVMPLWYGPDSVPQAAKWWADRVRRGRDDGARVPYLEVRYEQLVEQPESELRRICALIGLDFNPRMLSFHERVRQQAAGPGPRLLNPVMSAARAGEREEREDSPKRYVGPRQMHARMTTRLSGPPDTSSVGRWRTEMTRDEIRCFDEIAGDLLEELGYPRS